MTRGGLRENIVALSVLQGLNYVVPLVTVPYLVRVLGPAHFGLLSFAQALILYFDLLTEYGFSLSATRAVARLHDDPAALAHTFWRTMYAKAALMAASAGVLAIIVFSVPRFRAVPLLYASAFLTVVGTVTLPVWFFQGTGRLKFITMAHASARLLSIPALLLFVGRPEDYVRAAAIQGGVPVLASVFLAPVIWRSLRSGPHRPTVAETWATVKDGWSLFVVNGGLVLNTSTTTVVLGLVAGDVQVGFYSAADKVIRALTSLLGPVTQALYPHLNHLKVQSLNLTFRMMRRSFAWIIAVAIAVSAGTFALAGPLGLILWGPQYAASIEVLRWLAPLPFLLALINVIGTQTMLVLEMDAVLSRIILLGTSLNLFLVALLSAILGSVGAAAAMVTVTSLMVLALAWSLWRNLPALRRLGAPAECLS
jgi:polysaccharide transporter, PST family